MTFTSRHLTIFIAMTAFAAAVATHAGPRIVPNFALMDLDDRNHDLHRTPGRAVVLFFSVNGCPIVRKNATKYRELKDRFESKEVVFWTVNASGGDTKTEIQKEQRDIGLSSVPCLIDSKQSLALALGVQRTAEVVAIDTRDWSVFYRGELDDQLSEGAEKPAPTRKYLDEALSALIEGREIKTPKTNAHGCRISYATVVGDDAAPDYATQVAPILKQHCVECHRKDGIAPWSMSSHRRVAGYAEMIEEVLLTRRMPPWDPHPDYGTFLHPNSLTREETQTVLRWVEAGAPRGTAPDPLEEPLPPLPEWRLGKPGMVLTLPDVQKIPATGIVNYRYVKVANPFTNDVWLSALDVKPGNRKVVHHVILYANWPEAPKGGSDKGVFFIGWAPGAGALRYPQGVAKRLPADATLTFELHYTTSGSEETDQSEIALYLAEGPQERMAETRQAIQLHLNIPPGDPDAEHLATYAFKKPATIYGLFPHMHFRGKWMRYELLLPNGKRETLLHVPRYDFQWQLSYHLEQPRRVPAGTWLLVTGAFDNSVRNPANPDPGKRVVFGEQSWDEMFIGFFEAADDPEPPHQTSATSNGF
jgi:peroxiredoxin/mono/diheme cytochrome c family protein